ncbi:transcriptional regulator domain-containing protein [Novosphingobium resinovorum]|uniref:transcriptional regulator domain-containing protein n=1 Tax=Novosphingobium resinovorum TaxID=158500 RepID=UPI0039B74185
MACLALSEPHPRIVARALPDPALLSDPRAFAWEVLRRRGDYCAAVPANRRVGIRDGKIEVIVAVTATPQWGLRFRGNPGAECRQRSADVGSQTGSPDDKGDGTCMFGAKCGRV